VLTLITNLKEAKKALEMNGKIFEGNYIQVATEAAQKTFDNKKAVFIGNLKFGTLIE
jgi:hypothetical protein